MKRTFSAFSIVFLILTTIACGKTTKGKLANEWKVVDYEIKEDQENGESYSGFMQTMKDGVYYFSQYSNNNPDQTVYSEETKGAVLEHTFTIEKNGKWKRYCHYTLPQNVEMIVELTGTWSFIRKNKEEGFVRNERILFNVLRNETTTFYLDSNPEPIINYTDYAAGEMVEVYTIAESDRDGLTLQSDYEESSWNNYQDYYRKGFRKFVLHEE